jgi:large repetitive protein
MSVFATRVGAVRSLARQICSGAAALCFGLLSATGALAALDVSMSIAPTFANPIFPGDVTALRITLT